MDWKELLNSKIESGELTREDSTQTEETPREGVQREPLHVVTERKGRKGKTATIVEGFTCPDNVVDDVARKIKNRLGTGGSSRGGEILIQGDVADKVRNILVELGYKVK